MAEHILMSKFRECMAKSKDKRMNMEADFDVAYPTGYLGFDFTNGVKVEVMKEDGQKFSYNSIGIVDGSMVSIVGRSGCGKTTITLQMAGNIVRQYPESSIFHEELEAGSSSMRKRQLLKMTEEEFKDKYIVRNTGIDTENFFERIKTIHDLKLENYKDYEYDTGLSDPSGKRIFKLQPSVVILDSLAMLMPNEISMGGEIVGSMAITSVAKVNTQLVKRILPMLKAANIIFFVINHILPDPSPIPKKAQVAWLKVGERCPGGETAIYLANNFIRVDDSSKLDASKDLGINGIMVDLQLIKSRTNRPGVKVPMILNYDVGFDEELSLYVLLKEHKRINGAGAYLYIGDHTELKFQQKNIKTMLKENEDFKKIFIAECFDVLNELIKDSADFQETGMSCVTTDMLSMMNQMVA